MKNKRKKWFLALLLTPILLLTGISENAQVSKAEGAQENGNTYYIDDIAGADTNDGRTPEHAWKTVQKANTVTYEPGDSILFKCDGVFIGSFVPQGSGTSEKPIVIASYGKGERPLLKPSPETDWDSVDTYYREHWYVSNTDTPYKGVDQIRLENVSHYVIRDLELFDPNYEANRPEKDSDDGNNDISKGARYRRGIFIYNEDAGNLSGYKIENCAIHGYRGINSNRGKSSGGIIMQVNTSSDPSKRVASSINDITVTNCELYNLGRSGINFSTPWCGRADANHVASEGDRWIGSPDGDMSSDTGTYGYPSTDYDVAYWVPFQDITIQNNIVHHLDGDGILIDNCKNVLVENNLVYNAHMRAAYSVGIFPWNSDNVVIQNNEVYNTGVDHEGGTRDDQGIEIDALCRDVYVQYNYTHDNIGGVFMFCSEPDLRSMRGVFRYNISQYDGNGYGVIDSRCNTWDSFIYNNTVIMRENGGNFFTDHRDESKKPIAQNEQIFNNLFYYEGGAMNLSNKSSNLLRLDINTWQNNVFYNFPEPLTQTVLGGEENENQILNGEISEQNLLKNIGGGATGSTTAPSTSGVFNTLLGYTPQEKSPLLARGIALENMPMRNPNLTFDSHSTAQNGGVDIFGNPVYSLDKIDVGAVQTSPSEDKTQILFNKDSNGLKNLHVESGKTIAFSLKLLEPVCLDAQGNPVKDDQGNIDYSMFKGILKDANGKQIGGLLTCEDSVALGAGAYSITLYNYDPTQVNTRVSETLTPVDSGEIHFSVAETGQAPDDNKGAQTLPSTNEVKNNTLTFIGSIILVGVAYLTIRNKKKA